MATHQQLTKKQLRHKRYRKNRRYALQYCPQKHGTCTKVHVMTPKKPCSARRAFARVKLSNKIMVTCHIPGVRHNLKKFSGVLVRGGRPNDLPGVKYKIIRGARKSDTHPVYKRRNARSKYGVRNPRRFHRIRLSRGVGQKIYYVFH